MSILKVILLSGAIATAPLQEGQIKQLQIETNKNIIELVETETNNSLTSPYDISEDRQDYVKKKTFETLGDSSVSYEQALKLFENIQEIYDSKQSHIVIQSGVDCFAFIKEKNKITLYDQFSGVTIERTIDPKTKTTRIIVTTQPYGSKTPVTSSRNDSSAKTYQEATSSLTKKGTLMSQDQIKQRIKLLEDKDAMNKLQRRTIDPKTLQFELIFSYAGTFLSQPDIFFKKINPYLTTGEKENIKNRTTQQFNKKHIQEGTGNKK